MQETGMPRITINESNTVISVKEHKYDQEETLKQSLSGF